MRVPSGGQIILESSSPYSPLGGLAGVGEVIPKVGSDRPESKQGNPMNTKLFWLCVAVGIMCGSETVQAAERPAGQPSSTEQQANFSRTEDVVYGRRDGMALTMDVFEPCKRNGAGIIVFVSAGFRSNRDLLTMFHPAGTSPLLERGYVVFAVLHSSQPKYTVPEILEDAHRSVRFVKHNAKKYGVDPDRIGVAGGSAGGHLALMMGCAGKPGDSKSADAVERQSSKAAAVACFFPPTNFLALDGSCPQELAAPFDFREMDRATGTLTSVSHDRRRQIGREVSPLTHAASDSSPVLIIHGDKDKLVPLSQSEAMVAKLKACGVETELVVKPGKGHLWLGIGQDIPTLADWFDRHLQSKGVMGQ